MSAERAVYLDSSATVKLAVQEPESAGLRRYLSRRRLLVSSVLARTEVARALLGQSHDRIRRGLAVLRALDLLRLSERVLTAAGSLQPPSLRTLDAIHLASAMQLEEELAGIVTYDDRLRDAARSLGLRVASPD
jgi:predicted nucleic acid-binding protein